MGSVSFPKKCFATLTLISLCAAQAAFASSNKKQDEMAGAVLFRDKGCGFCHGADLKGTRKAPALEDIRKEKEWTDDKISSQLLDGGQKMPPFRDSLSDDEVKQLVAFLRARHKPVPPPASAAPATPQQ
jgi:mono/diheme cytochrome c family protein